jgi:hypothetical protein
MAGSAEHDALVVQLTRRGFLHRAGALGLGALVASAAPWAQTTPAALAAASAPDATLQAFADTILPGRKATSTDLGNAIDPRAIAGVDPLPGAVEADALALYHHPEVGFDALAPAFLGELEARSLLHGGDFLSLASPARVQVCLSGLDFSNTTRLIWEAAAAVPFTAFCAAALIRNATAARASGYRVMGLPGTAPNGYRGYSYRRKLNHGRTKHGSLP